MTRTTRTLTAALAVAAAVVVAVLDQARHTTCPCGGCGGTR